MTEVSIYHISEIFLYEYYMVPDEYEVREEDEAGPLIDRAEKLEKKNKFDEALTLYQQALFENPVSMAIRGGMIRCLRRLGDFERMHAEVIDSFPFLCTRAEIAAYYRSLGYYYVEKYQPQLAYDLYRFSRLYFPTESADHEIAFLEEAQKQKNAALAIRKKKGEPVDDAEDLLQGGKDEIMERLRKAEIPIGPSEVTLALLFKAGEEAQEKGLQTQALDCYRMVFDLTQDPTLESKIAELS